MPYAIDDSDFESRLVGVLADDDDELVRQYLDDDTTVSSRRLRGALAAQTRKSRVYPVFCGSALTGAGVDTLTGGIAELLPTSSGDDTGPLSGVVFKIERGPSGDRIAYARMFSGTVRTRDRVHFGRDGEAKVTAIKVFDDGTDAQRPSVSAGEIAKVWGLGGVQIGDSIGDADRALQHEFPPPTLESVVAPRDLGERQQLRVALTQLAEQDPLINVRQDDARQELSVSLYGEVQKEVIQATLASDYGLDVTFRATTPIYIERPIATGEAIEALHAETNPFNATIAFRVDPAPPGSAIEFGLRVDPLTAPLFVYKTLESFAAHMDEYVRHTLQEGPHGWQVTDCTVTMTRCDYSIADGPPSRRGPTSTAADYRKLTPLVLMQALERAGTVVCEPTLHVVLEIPADTIGAVIAAVARLGGAVETPSLRGDLAVVETVLPEGRARDLQRQLSGLTRGEGVLESTFAGYEPVIGEQPSRR
jgi:ribosomal protection tetracycline resistance protein